MNGLCLCGSGLTMQKCCLNLIKGNGLAQTAEALMRSRFSAYCTKQSDYLLTTWHPLTRPSKVKISIDIEWLALEICHVRAGEKGDNEGWVEFKASFKDAGQFAQIHENSRFVFEEGTWFYVDGEHKAESLPSRNTACPCGSGKKFKRCCAN